MTSLVGAGLILTAYVASQRRWWRSTGRPYLWCNLVGALLLTGVAVADRRLGFVLLEAVWAAVSSHALVRPTSPLGSPHT